MFLLSIKVGIPWNIRLNSFGYSILIQFPCLLRYLSLLPFFSSLIIFTTFVPLLHNSTLKSSNSLWRSYQTQHPSSISVWNSISLTSPDQFFIVSIFGHYGHLYFTSFKFIYILPSDNFWLIINLIFLNKGFFGERRKIEIWVCLYSFPP